MTQPLADALRPMHLKDFIGQRHLIGEGMPLQRIIEEGVLPSMIFWGPPASGKTTLAKIIAQEVGSVFLSLSAVMDGKDELKKIVSRLEQDHPESKQIILFIDEIHRWNKAQQDALLPYVENGSLVLIGATTENPSFSVNAALLSRCRVFVFETHRVEDIQIALFRGLECLGANSELSDGTKSDLESIVEYIAVLADGDMRFALTTLEIVWRMGKGEFSKELVEKAAQKSLLYDKAGEEHYNLISAVHKSLRSSNPTAGVYWVMRMLAAGEDPLYIARRMVRFASEDIGNSNPNALLLANQVYDAVKNLGMPECETALVQLAEYLARSPKDNSAYVATNLAREDIKKYGSLPVPMHFRNAPTKLMKDLGYGKGYEYDHDLSNKKSNQQAMPDKLKNQDYFPNHSK